jgi:hypothetical protein
VVKQAIDANRSAQNAEAATSSNSNTTAAAESGRLSFVFLAVLIAALPVIVVFGSFPSGLISAFIIFIGMRQAWRMTGAPLLQILGPYRVGAAPATSP